MNRIKTVLLVVAMVGVPLAACSSSSSNDTTTTTSGGVTTTTAAGTPVTVTLDDTKGLDAPMTMTVDPTSVPAGNVTFTVKNEGTIEHEMVVLKTDTPATDLTVGADGKVSEDASIGEVSETPAGKTGTVTLDMKAGHYVLVCNVAKHYGLGMVSDFTVT